MIEVMKEKRLNKITLNIINEYIESTDLPCTPEHCIFFDDAVPNLKSAKELGFYTVLIGESEDEFEFKKPEFVDFVFASIQDCLRNEHFLTHFGLRV